MADVFISYASEDRDRIAPLVMAIEGAGFSVWWDTRIGTGSSFDREIERELDATKCVVVIWSEHSVDSDWVRAEATEALERQILVPAIIDDVRPPLVFRRAQTARLFDWPKSRDGLEALIGGVRDVCNRTGAPVSKSVDTAGSHLAAHAGNRSTPARKWSTKIVALVKRALRSSSAREASASGSGIGAPDDLLNRPAVAVLPFADLSADGDQQYLADGLAEELIMLGHFGSDEAAKQLEVLIRLQPGFDLDYIDATYPFCQSDDRDRFLHGLEAAGWQQGFDYERKSE